MPSYSFSGGENPPKFNTEKAKAVSKPVIITGGSGKLGRACVKEFKDHGYFTINLDVMPPPAGTPPANIADAYVNVQLTDYGEVLSSLICTDDRYQVDPAEVAVVHLAAYPAGGLKPNATLFAHNVTSEYNVMEACRRLKIRNLVWASSETLIGLPLDPVFPDSLPITEDSQPPRPETAYSLSKLVGETIAGQYCRWEPEMKIISLRFSNVMQEPDYAARFPTWQDDDKQINRRWNAFCYIDARDGAQACRKSVEAQFTGHHVYYIANADSVFHAPTLPIIKKHFPGVKINEELWKANRDGLEDKFPDGCQGMFGIGKAKKELGFMPQYTWRDYVKSP